MDSLIKRGMMWGWSYIGHLFSDKTYIEVRYLLQMGKKLNLAPPKTFSEKLQWMKLYDRKPEYTMMVDKYAVKKYVADIIGEEYVIPTLGVWEKTEDIEWNKLPNKFVLKTTHSGGSLGVVICKNKQTFDKNDAIHKLSKNLHSDAYRTQLEWPYKNVPRRIIAEQYIEPDPLINDLPDYKFFCFDGEVKALFVATDRQKEGEEVKFDFFDADFNHLQFRQGHENALHIPSKPGNFDKMKQIASRLSKGFPQVRIDLYDVNGRVLFGEMTFFHFSGMTPFNPEEWDYKFGSWVKLPIE